MTCSRVSGPRADRHAEPASPRSSTRSATEPAYALDTEFHRERTYFPKLALVQVAWRDGLALVDPLAVDLAPFAEILDGPGVAVLHAVRPGPRGARAGLRHLPDAPVRHPGRRRVRRHVDRRRWPASTSGRSASGCRKADRLTDWLARPLQRRASSTTPPPTSRTCSRSTTRSSPTWTAAAGSSGPLDECEDARARERAAPATPTRPGGGSRRSASSAGRPVAVAQAVAGVARAPGRRARPAGRRFVLSDLAVVGVAQRQPTLDRASFRKIRGLDDRHLRGDQADGLLGRGRRRAGADRSRPAEEHRVPRARPRAAPGRRPRVGLGQPARPRTSRSTPRCSPPAATSRRCCAGDADARLTIGWRAELVGEPIRRLVDGEAALAFDGKGELVLEERSHRDVTCELRPDPTGRDQRASTSALPMTASSGHADEGEAHGRRDAASAPPATRPGRPARRSRTTTIAHPRHAPHRHRRGAAQGGQAEHPRHDAPRRAGRSTRARCRPRPRVRWWPGRRHQPRTRSDAADDHEDHAISATPGRDVGASRRWSRAAEGAADAGRRPRPRRPPGTRCDPGR